MVQRGLTPPKSDSPVLPKGLLSELAEKEAKSEKWPSKFGETALWGPLRCLYNSVSVMFSFALLCKGALLASI